MTSFLRSMGFVIAFACLHPQPGFAKILQLLIEGSGKLEVVAQSVSNVKPTFIYELNPTIVKSGHLTTVFVSTDHTWMCQSDAESNLVLSLTFNKHECALLTVPSRNASISWPYNAWNYSYDGVTGASMLKMDGTNRMFLVRQGENKNEIVDGHRIYNTLVENDVQSDCFSGVQGGRYSDCFSQYFSFINGAYLDVPRQEGTGPVISDLGPVIWPEGGYFNENGRRVSAGVRSPSLISAFGFIYLYYNDTSSRAEQGRGQGLKVARARISEDRNIGPFIPLYKGTFDPDNASLPAGFDKQSMLNFVRSPGGLADLLWKGAEETYKFRVSCIVSSNIFIGVAESGGFNGIDWRLDLRVSDDLVHWSDPVQIPGMQASNWESGDLHYPILTNEFGEQSNVDVGRVYLLGVTKGGKVVRQLLQLRLVE